MFGPKPPPLPDALPPVIQAVAPPPLPLEDKSVLLLFFRGWCGLFVLFYLSMAIYEIQVARGATEPSLGLIESAVSHNNQSIREEIIAEKRADAPGIAVFVIGLAVIYGCAASIPRQPWAWTFGLVIICTTVFPFIISAAGAIPLLIQWVSPASKRYFGKRP